VIVKILLLLVISVGYTIRGRKEQ